MVFALVSVRGKADVESLVHASLMPVLLARAVSSLGHIKMIYVNICMCMQVNIL